MRPSQSLKAVEDARAMFQTFATVADHFGLRITAAAARFHLAECDEVMEQLFRDDVMRWTMAGAARASRWGGARRPH